MTNKQTAAKQKAVEIVEKYKFVYIPNYTSMHEVKQCALIAVDEAIKAVDYVCTNDKIWYINYDFWQQVRSEIEKI